ncbi:exodeoxyribonuclease III [Deinococcus aquiradiocola]|uniref:Exodeoxyribonuclease III n=1 Tax=Deinococcus aquiradiocola TaxID=393059 RepID=A0A917P4Y4_9DEIO|nr:exodeoxyribonuclease III [Deinococcus aquiradiocola]GGJ61908.1 exodeoxyribonuclease III [Deinococcus aquiradiocola]
MLPGVHVVTLNLNGLRSALRKGLLPWLEEHAPDVLLLQEVRASSMPEVFAPLGYHSVWHPASRAGYSGVAILSREALQDVVIGIGDPLLDDEGRLVSGVLHGVRYASLYLPSGSSGEERQGFKDRSLPILSAWVQARLQEGPLVLGGDFNVAHREIDIRNWRGNVRNSGFLPHERAWMGELLALGLRDTHRETLGEQAAYTWWSNRANAYANDVGWRIDYLLSAGVDVRDVTAHRAARLSDHAPLGGRVRALTQD